MNKYDFFGVIFIIVLTICAMLTVSFLGGLIVGSQATFNRMLIINDGVEIISGFVTIPFIFTYGYILIKICEIFGLKVDEVK
jgi:hypothetical protein